MKSTTSTVFLVKPLDIIEKEQDLKTSKLVKDFGFLDAFIKDVNHEMDYSHPLYLLFKQDHAILSFREFVQDEYERGLLTEDYDYPEGYIVLLYEYPERFREDYDKIIQGRYSETSREFKDCFPIKTMFKGKESGSYYTNIFNKSEEIKATLRKAFQEFGVEFDENAEVRPAPEIEAETLDIQKYLNG